MKNTAVISAITLLALSAGCLAALPGTRDLYADTWVATDGIGRVLPMAPEVRAPQEKKTVGMFYFLWHNPDMGGPWDITKINQGTRTWGGMHGFHHWSEPEVGYYISTDPWVYRRHVRMLSDMGVDVLFMDATNAATYETHYKILLDVMQQMRQDGETVPQVAFITWSSSGDTTNRLMKELYTPGLFKDFWFIYKGKPLILGKAEEMSKEALDFFTVRASWAFNGGKTKDYWTWIDHYPQGVAWSNPGDKEEMSVSVGGHPHENRGRSLESEKQPPIEKVTPEKGLMFAQMWKRALEVDPDVIFIDGWNEWIAQRFENQGYLLYAGRPAKIGDPFFVDTYDREFNRDMEPMKGDYTDATYYQGVTAVRQYKGARPLPLAGAPKSITIDGNMSDWMSVQPEFRDHVKDTATRNSKGWNKLQYVNNTGRNDIMNAKVSRDGQNVYFMAETYGPLSPEFGPDWMLLYVDADNNHSTGWMGYDYIVNSAQLGRDLAEVSKWDGQGWVKCGRAHIVTSNNALELSVPKSVLGLAGKSRFTIDFKWADNIQDRTSIESFFLNGDVAPERRFNYRYQVK